MIKKILAITVAALALLPAKAQEGGDAFLRQQQKRDSVLIADQLSYVFVAACFGEFHCAEGHARN